MRRFAWQLLAVSSLVCIGLANAATRPQYGGTLRVMTRMSLSSLDPSDASQPDSIFRGDLDRLLFDTLVTIDDFGRIQPALAISWKAQAGNRAWEFTIRPDVKFDDGSPLTPTAVATSLRAVNPRWGVSALADSVLIETDAPEPLLPAQLAEPRYSIVKRTPARILVTGPFHMTDWQSGKSISMDANEDYWAGRPFVNTIEIAFGKTYRDQSFALQLGRTDVTEIPLEEARRSLAEARGTMQSAPIQLMALVFSRDPASAEERKLRDVLSLSIDRNAIRNVLLQGNGEPSGAILPNWMSGYAFVFPSTDIEKAHQLRLDARQTPMWALKYDSSDPLSRLVAERVSLNAKEVGINLQPAVNGSDLRLVIIALSSINGPTALSDIAASLGLPAPAIKSDGLESLYEAEAGLLDTKRVIPLFHLPVSYAVGPMVKNWQVRRDGTRDLGDAWLSPEKP